MTEQARDNYEAMSFEEAMKRLEEVVEKLEDGNVPLEQAIALFQEGISLSKRCSEQLNAAEGKIEMLIEENSGAWVKKSFDPEED